MVDNTSASESLSAEAVAEKLESIASELRQDGDTLDVEVGNKSVSLTPPTSLDYEVTVAEREPMIGSKRESIAIDMSWKTDE